MKVQREVRQLYQSCDHEHDHSPAHALAYTNPTGLDSIVERVLQRVHRQQLKAGDLDADLWLANAHKIWEGGAKGLGPGWNTDITRLGMALQLQQNAHIFAAFKNHHNINALVGLLTDKGRVRSWAEFKKAAMPLMDKYNQHWLRTEYNHAIGSARMADKWHELSRRGGKGEYITVGDERVRTSHRLLHGTLLPFDHPFWQSYWPPNGWNCRCDVRWHPDDTQSQSPGGLPDDVPPEMQFNPGQQGLLYSRQHPYFANTLPAAQRYIMQQIDRLKGEAKPFPIWKGKRATVAVHPFADVTEADINARTAMTIARNESIDVAVRKHVQIQNVSNPELWILNKYGDIKRPSSVENGFMNAVDDFRGQLRGVSANAGVLVFELTEEMDFKRFAQRVKGGWKNRPWITDVILVRDQGRKSRSIHLTHKTVDWDDIIHQIQKALQ